MNQEPDIPDIQVKSYIRTPKSDNTSGIIGVSLNKKRNRWKAYIKINKKIINLGSYYKFKEDAIKARLEGELKYLGKFAPQANLFEQYGITENTNTKNTFKKLSEDIRKRKKYLSEVLGSEKKIEKEITGIADMCFYQNLYQNNYYYE